ncbi:MAG: biotin/lipoyl-containing protein [Planctomycetia bacterium]
MSETIPAVVRHEGERVLLCAPEVGLFAGTRARGEALVAGSELGTLIVLGRERRVLVPDGVQGRIAGEALERVRAPVAFGDCLAVLEPLRTDGASASPTAQAMQAAEGGLALRSPQSGRFYHRPAPKEAAFVEAGSSVQDGQPIGLIEVMKTFTNVSYRAKDSLPARARVVRYLVADGGDVKSGQPLLEVEPA